MVRKCALFLCLSTLFYAYFSYKDEHLENYKVLQRIENQLQDLSELKPLKSTHVLRECFHYNLLQILQIVYLILFIDFLTGFSERLAIKRLKTTADNTSIQ